MNVVVYTTTLDVLVDLTTSIVVASSLQQRSTAHVVSLKRVRQSFTDRCAMNFTAATANNSYKNVSLCPFWYWTVMQCCLTLCQINVFSAYYRPFLFTQSRILHSYFCAFLPVNVGCVTISYGKFPCPLLPLWLCRSNSATACIYIYIFRMYQPRSYKALGEIEYT